MKDKEENPLIKDLLKEVKNSAFSVLPIYALMIILTLFGILEFAAHELVSFTVSTAFIILGIALFNYGAERATTPIGKKIGRGLTKQGKIGVLIVVFFAFGFLITVSEPDLSVLAMQTSAAFPKLLLIISIGLGVALFLVLAVLRVIKKESLVSMLAVLYMVAFGLVALNVYRGNEAMLPLCFDSGGVTTGPMTVPFLMSLGAGVALILAKKSEKDASFGLVAFSSVGPVIVMLLLTFFYSKNIEYELPDYSIPANFFASFFHYVFEKLKEVGIAIGMLYICYLIVDRLFLKTPKKKVIDLGIGLLFVYVGLVLFLAAVDCSYMGIGYKIGTELSKSGPVVTSVICMIIGALTVLAEPAVRILTTQVEEITNEFIKKKTLLITLAVGVGAAIALSAIRIIFGFSILYVLIPGYALCFILSFFIPKIYTAIAFDAGGVVSGPLTSSFILPIALGLCAELQGEASILSLGFGVVAFVALSPLISIEVLGVVSAIKNKRRARKAIEKVLREDDRMIISFETEGV